MSFARKNHQCWHCYWVIQKNTLYNIETNVCDGKIYSLKTHTECDLMHRDWIKDGLYYDDEGYQTMYDDMVESGENFMQLCASYEKKFPDATRYLALSYRYSNIGENNES